jgi:hypothetical protein
LRRAMPLPLCGPMPRRESSKAGHQQPGSSGGGGGGGGDGGGSGGGGDTHARDAAASSSFRVVEGARAVVCMVFDKHWKPAAANALDDTLPPPKP